MSKKQNPMLAAFEAKLEKNYKERLEINSEFDMIALMKTVHDELGVGPGRAAKILNAFLANKVEIAETIHEDYGDKDSGDKEILHTKKQYAQFLKSIFKPEDWDDVKYWFPLLREYWEV